MKKMYGGALVVSLVLLGLVFLVTATLVGSYISAANYGVRAENEIKAVWENNQNVLGQYTTKVQEAAQVPAMYRDDLKTVVVAAVQGRYGANGSKAVMQWLKEANIPFDASMYNKMQQIIESGRNQFQAEQTRLVDVKRTYSNNLGYVWRGFWLNLAGYPKIDLSKYMVITTDGVAEAFKTGKQGPIKLRE